MLKKLTFLSCMMAGAGCLMGDEPQTHEMAPLGGVMTDRSMPFVPGHTINRDLGHADVQFDIGGGGGGEVCIDFDNRTEPCVFASTRALRNRFSALGILFDGPSRLDGGGILDQCGNFGVNARSGLNFLAFNPFCFGCYSNGGTPTDPQTVRFDADASSVSIWVSGGVFDGRWRMDAFDGSGNLLDTGNVATNAGSYGELSTAASGIRRVVITETGGADYFVMDDLCVNFDGAGDCLELAVDPLVAGRRACWNVTGATPGEQVAVVYGFQPGNTSVNGLFGYCATFGIQGVNTNKVVCRKNADGAGNVQCCKTIPQGARGTRVLSQAAERNTCPDECVSNVDDQAIQ